MGIIARIRELERDLSAEIVIQEEEGHTEVDAGYLRGRLGFGHGQVDWDPAAGDSWVSDETKREVDEIIQNAPQRCVIDKPKITHPNTQKRETARQELQHIYDSAKWYQFIRKYSAGRALKRRGWSHLLFA